MINSNDYREKQRAYNDAVNLFVDTALTPELLQCLDAVFNPPFDFKRKGQRWESTGTDINGTQTQGAKVFCYANNSRGAFIGGGNEKSGLNGGGLSAYEIYMKLHGLRHYDEAVRQIAKILGVEGCPTWEAYGVKASEDAMKRRADGEKAAQIMADALQSGTAEAEKVRNYLLTRLTESEYKRALENRFIGLADTATLKRIEREAPEAWKGCGVSKGIGTIHTVAIITPYGGDPCASVVFRCLPEYEDRYNKYNTLTGCDRSKLVGLENTRSSVIVVEGELDALKARLALQDAGVTGVCVVACGQNQINEERAANAVKRGVKKFTVIPDNDAAGRERLGRSVDNLFAAGANSVYVSELPDDAKDTAEYISAHGVKAWLEEVRNHTKTATAWQTTEAINKYLDAVADTEGAHHEERGALLDTLKELACKTDRELNNAAEVAGVLKLAYNKVENLEIFLNIDPSDVLKFADNKTYADAVKRRDTAFKEAQAKAAAMSESGRTEEAAEIMEEALRKFNTKEARRQAHARLLTPPQSVADAEAELRRTKKTVPTKLYFKTEHGQMQQFRLKEGVTLIAGARKHGKTTLLLNFVFEEARRNFQAWKSGEDADLKKTLLFTYEMTRSSVIMKLLSIYLNNDAYGNNSFRSIRSYYSGEGNYFAGGTQEDFENRKGSFFRELIVTGAITIIEENYTAEELLQCTADFMEGNAVTMVAVDYIQELNSEQRTTLRTEELKRIGTQMRDFANGRGVPFLCAAQFNRIESLLDVDTRNIGEAGDLERNAVDVIGIFNLKELAAFRGNMAAYDYALCEKILTRWGVDDYAETLTIQQGEDKKAKPYTQLKPVYGKLYAKLMASRYDEYPAEVMLEFKGSTGVIDLQGSEKTCKDCAAEQKKQEEAQRRQQELPFKK